VKELDDVTDEGGQGYGERLLSLVMLNVIDEKWKDHLYDLDQLRAAIHYRSWGQKDPLVEYKQEAYTMFVDLMNDLASTFTERFLKAQLVFDPIPTSDPYAGGDRRAATGDGSRTTASSRSAATTHSASSRTSPSRSCSPARTGSNGVHDGPGRRRGRHGSALRRGGRDVEDLATGEPQA
jgi:preprotein translocase subunit SecA